MENFNLVCSSLTKSYSSKSIFKNLSINLSTGQSLAVVGRNGSGKSTLVKVIANLIQPDKGSVKCFSGEKEILRENSFVYTGLLSPYLNLYDELSGIENLEFFYRLKSGEHNSYMEKVKYFLEKVNLYERRNDLLKNYSSGMKQRLKLAFAVMNEPELLLFDEPGSNLDAEGSKIVLEIADEQKKKGILIIATNDEQEKLLCSDYINVEDYK